jgi:hypothetical protein
MNARMDATSRVFIPPTFVSSSASPRLGAARSTAARLEPPLWPATNCPQRDTNCIIVVLGGGVLGTVALVDINVEVGFVSVAALDVCGAVVYVCIAAEFAAAAEVNVGATVLFVCGTFNADGRENAIEAIRSMYGFPAAGYEYGL